MNTLSQAPAKDEVEVSLFGPGYGECIVVHLGHQRWLIVDSCRDRRTRRPIALDYLSGLNEDTHVGHIVATHWHDDHVAGLAELVEAYPRAKVVISAALNCDEFFALVKLVEPDVMVKHSGVQELARVMKILADRTKHPSWALADRRIERRAGRLPAEVWTLAPSDYDITQTKLALAKLYAPAGTPHTPKRAVPRPQRNHAAVVAHVRVGVMSILLGSDLEVTSTPNSGWDAVIASSTRPSEKCSVYKVAHHGSITGHDNRIWTDLLSQEPVAILTPFCRGGVKLPTQADVARISGLSTSLWATALCRQPPSSDDAVLRFMTESTLGRRDLGNMGHVRLRRRSDEPEWRIERFGSAQQLA